MNKLFRNTSINSKFRIGTDRGALKIPQPYKTAFNIKHKQ